MKRRDLMEIIEDVHTNMAQAKVEIAQGNTQRAAELLDYALAEAKPAIEWWESDE